MLRLSGACGSSWTQRPWPATTCCPRTSRFGELAGSSFGRGGVGDIPLKLLHPDSGHTLLLPCYGWLSGAPCHVGCIVPPPPSLQRDRPSRAGAAAPRARPRKHGPGCLRALGVGE